MITFGIFGIFQKELIGWKALAMNFLYRINFLNVLEVKGWNERAW